MTEVSYPKDRTLVEDTMRKYGGSFVKLLAEVSLNADYGIHFAKAVLDCLRAADLENALLMKQAFPDLYLAAEGLSEDERTGLLYDAFSPIFDKYAAMAPALVP